VSLLNFLFPLLRHLCCKVDRLDSFDGLRALFRHLDPLSFCLTFSRLFVCRDSPLQAGVWVSGCFFFCYPLFVYQEPGEEIRFGELLAPLPGTTQTLKSFQSFSWLFPCTVYFGTVRALAKAFHSPLRTYCLVKFPFPFPRLTVFFTQRAQDEYFKDFRSPPPDFTQKTGDLAIFDFSLFLLSHSDRAAQLYRI